MNTCFLAEWSTGVVLRFFWQMILLCDFRWICLMIGRKRCTIVLDFMQKFFIFACKAY